MTKKEWIQNYAEVRMAHTPKTTMDNAIKEGEEMMTTAYKIMMSEIGREHAKKNKYRHTAEKARLYGAMGSRARWGK